MSKYIVISYYTKYTPYEGEVKSLVSSLQKFELEYDIPGLEPFKNWQEATVYKATFILEMLKKHQPRPIVWIDADAVLKSKPFFFDMIDADAAFYYRTNGGRVPRIPEDGELISASMYFKTNERVKLLLMMWIEENNKGGRDLEQHNLQKIIPEWRRLGGIHSILPQTYCKIFDSDNDLLTIQQNQASRRFQAAVGG